MAKSGAIIGENKMGISLSRLSSSERALSRVGTLVQKYRIERLIGVGGMAAVYAATHRNGHRVAMKFLLDRFWDDAEIGRLFSREAYVANQVGHPGAVPVLDDDIDDEGCPFLVMPLLEGETLRARWERAKRRLPLVEVVVWMTDVLEVLESAHACGIVHRDIKPDNLFVTTKGEVRVLDFGIARRIDSDGTTTLGGRLVGTPAFMPPEQALGDRSAMGPHSDCWAVGATTFALLSGEFVHKAENSGAQLVAAATQVARSLTEVLPNVPSAIGGVVDKALAFDAADRWHLAREMRDALLAALAEALGEPSDAIDARVRREIVAELSTRNTHWRAMETQAAEREPGGDKLAMSVAPTPPSEHESPATPDEHARPELGRGDAIPTVMAAGIAKSPSRRGTGLRRALVGGVAALLLSGVAYTATHKSATRGSIPPEQHAPIGTPVTTLPISPTCTKEAERHFRRGLTALRQAAYEVAHSAFEQASAVDPSCPEVQVQRALTAYAVTYSPVQQREQFRSALARRDALSERDRAVLDALAPLVVAEPPDRQESAHRFRAAVERFPFDAQILELAGWASMLAGFEPSSYTYQLDVARRATDIDPLYADGWITQAQALVRLGKFDEAMSVFDRCLEVAPAAADCLDERARTLRLMGKCSEVVENVRQWLAIVPTSSLAYMQLANGLASEGASVETIDATLQQWRSNAQSEGQEGRYLYYRALARALAGDFSTAENILKQLSLELRGSAVLAEHGRASMLLSDVLLESGKNAKAIGIAERFFQEREAWTRGPVTTTLYEGVLLGTLLVHGKIAPSQWNTLSETWENAAVRAMSHREAWSVRWGLACNTPGTASDAWTRRPQEDPPTTSSGQPLFLHSLAKAFEGHVALVSGDNAQAVKALEASIVSCDAFEMPFVSTRSYLWLGQAKERTGDIAGACDAFAVVLKRWGNAKPRSVTAEEARKRMVDLGCGAGR